MLTSIVFAWRWLSGWIVGFIVIGYLIYRTVEAYKYDYTLAYGIKAKIFYPCLLAIAVILTFVLNGIFL